MLVERGLFAQATSARRPHTFPKAKARHTTAPRGATSRPATPRPVQHDKPVTMSCTKGGAAVLGQRGDSVLGNGVCVDGVGFVLGDVNVVATNQSDAQHNLGHG
jgi:hypothetical protein